MTKKVIVCRVRTILPRYTPIWLANSGQSTRGVRVFQVLRSLARLGEPDKLSCLIHPAILKEEPICLFFAIY